VSLLAAVLSLHPALSDGPVVVRRVASVPGTGNLLSELLGAGGFVDADWTTTTSGGTVTPNNASGSGCGSGTGWGGECLKIDAGVFAGPFVNNTFAAQSGNIWFRGRLKVDFVLSLDNNAHSVAGFSTAAAGGEGNGALTIRLVRDAGPNYRLKLYIFSAGGTSVLLDTYPAGSLATSDQLCVEFQENITTHAWEWRLNGASEGSGTEVTIDLAPTDLFLGSYRALSTGDADTQYWDQIEVSTTGWLGCS